MRISTREVNEMCWCRRTLLETATASHTFRKIINLDFEIRLLRRMFGAKWDEETGNWNKLRGLEL